jgi:hypothetical protein
MNMDREKREENSSAHHVHFACKWPIDNLTVHIRQNIAIEEKEREEKVIREDKTEIP